MCVQRFDDSLDPAIRITYRVSRRSSSLWEPRDPSLKDIVGRLVLCLWFKRKGGVSLCGAKKGKVKLGERPAPPETDGTNPAARPRARVGAGAGCCADFMANHSV